MHMPRLIKSLSLQNNRREMSIKNFGNGSCFLVYPHVSGTRNLFED